MERKRNPQIVLILIGAAILSIFLQDPSDAAIILAISQPRPLSS